MNATASPATPPAEVYDVIVIGAGLAGLAVAHYAARAGWRPLVLEASDRVGGCVHSHSVVDDHWQELGAHSCYNSYGHTLGLMEDLGLMDHLLIKAKAPFRLLVEDRITSIPRALRFLELLAALPRGLTLDKAQWGVADYYGRLVGRRNYRDVFGPAFSAVICQPADDFPAACLFGRRQRRKDVPRSFTLIGGLQRLVDALAAQPGVEVRTGVPVAELAVLDPSASDDPPSHRAGVEVTTADGSRHRGRFAVVATPVDRARALLAEPLPAAAAPLAGLESAWVETVAVAWHTTAAGPEVDLPRLAVLIARDDVFYAAISRDVVPHGRYRGLTFYFKPKVLDAEAKLQRIGQLLRLDPAALAGVATKVNALPALRLGHFERVAQVDAALAEVPVALTGNYFTGVSLEDCVRRSRLVFDARLGPALAALAATARSNSANSDRRP